jgi:chromosome segregation ATPase
LQQSVQPERERAEALAGELAKARREIEEATQLKRTADSETAGMQQSVQQQRERAEALAGELAKARRENEEAAQLKRTAESETAGMQQSLQQQRERVEVLTGELAKARREIEAQATLSRTKSEEAAQLKRTAESAPTGLQQERDRAEAMARRNAEAQAALSSNKDDEARRLKPALEAATTGLQQSAQQERDKTGGPAAGPKSTAGPVDARLPFAPNDQTVKWRQAAAEQRAAAEPKGEAARLLERANALLGEGNIGAARVVLERAAEIGSIQATFRLAETYDPLVLSIWRTYGTRGDATKARELYAKAYDGGIKAAKDRSDALQAAGLEAK